MKHILMLLTGMVLIGCTQDPTQSVETTEPAGQQAPKDTPKMLGHEQSSSLAMYASMAVMGCKTAGVARNLELLGGKVDSKPVPQRQEEFVALYKTADEFPGVQEAVKAVRTAEIACFASPSTAGVGALANASAALQTELDLATAPRPSRTKEELERLLADARKSAATLDGVERIAIDVAIDAYEEELRHLKPEP